MRRPPPRSGTCGLRYRRAGSFSRSWQCNHGYGTLDHEPIGSDHDLISLFEHDLRANASRLSRGKPVSTFPDHAVESRRNAPSQHDRRVERRIKPDAVAERGPAIALRERNRALARISHRVKRIGAPNQRKLFCENDFLMIRGEPRCRQSVSRIFLDLKPSKAARWWRRLTVVRSHRMRGRCCWARRIGRSGWWIGWHRALSIGDPRRRSSIRLQRWLDSGYSPSRSATKTSTTMRRCATIH